MHVDDRAADRQAETEPLRFRGDERLEDALETIRRDPFATVANRDAHLAVAIESRECADGAFERIATAHRVERIDEQIQYDLLQLDLVAAHHRVAAHELHDIAQHVADIEPHELQFVLLHERANAANHFARAAAVVND